MTLPRPCLAMASLSPPVVEVPLRLLSGAEAVLTQVALRLWTVRGTWPDDVLLGLPHLAWGAAGVPGAEVEAVVRRQVASVEGVLEIVEVTASWTGAARSLVVRIIIQGLDGPTEALVGDLAAHGFTPGVWYLLVAPGYRPIIPWRG